jgi:F-type H+-transporting ATPase subunit a
MDITNKNLWVLFTAGDTTVYVTQTLLSTWVVMACLIIFAAVVRIRLRKFRAVPKGLQNVIETLVEMMRTFARETLGEELEHWGAYFFGAFSFILFSNYIGLLPFNLRPPTADLATTGALALITFLLIHGLGLVRQKGKYIKSFVEPIAFFLPINIIGEIAKPLSLAFRLFGNILSGVIIAGMLYGMLPIALRFVLPDVAHVWFDILVGALQTYVFTTLSMTFIQQKSSDIFS